MATTIDNIFTNTKAPIKYENYTMGRGVADFSNMAQWNRFEKGYYFLIVVDIPNFLKKLASQQKEYAALLTTYVHILEYEFRGLSGLEDMTGETGEITDGISTVNMINKVTWQSGSTFTMNYNERSGSLLTKVNELFLTGVKDPRSQFKHYHGLIGFDDTDGNVDTKAKETNEKQSGLGYAPVFSPSNKVNRPGFEQECFKFLYFNTDNTGKAIERAYYIVSAQPTKAELSIYAGEKGNYEFPELSMEFSGYPIIGPEIDDRAFKILKQMHASDLYINSRKYKWDAVDSNTHSGAGSNDIRLGGTGIDFLAGNKMVDDSGQYGRYQ